MKNKITTILIIVLSVAVGVLGSYLVFQDDDVAELATDSTVKGSRVIKTTAKGSVKKVKEISLVEKADGKRAVRIVKTAQVKPGAAAESDSDVEDIDEENLTSAQKAVLKELQEALDANNLRRVRKALSKLVAKADVGGLGGGKVPVCMRKRAVEALGWFGKDAAVDLMEYMADSNEEVANDAYTQFEQALSDSEMGDVERAKILTAAMSAINDGDQVESLLNQLNDMRNSVKAQTAGEILQTGTEAAKGKMREQLEFYFDDGVADADGLAKWQAMNPDDATDAETYGGAQAKSQESDKNAGEKTVEASVEGAAAEPETAAVNKK